ncbi:Uncharacterized membrane protein [Pseudoxanthomonas sp. GM95]|uniref:DUF2339 domain-containing protein n=1 Tax=Pseudoxanthomonas sp. GM95 TaxID=1881043 RepID=UPI0008D6BD0E|nr:DUF2339 domain-containing protein [Pseudoxanthomonas sp. GM95]SEL71563.1 Uncharacterized membrane protein [Pseudoxanthomonas sp. GM95]
MEALIVLIGLAVLAVPILLIVALVSIRGLRRRVEQLERDLAAGVGPARAASPWISERAPASTRVNDSAASEVATAPAQAPRPPSPPFQAGAAQTAPPPAASAASPSRVNPTPPPLPAAPPRPIFEPASAAPDGPDPFTRLLTGAKRWLTEGNVPVKVGMLVLLAGVAALLKYGGDQGWFRLPIELRYAGIAAAALGGLVFGWRQRGNRPGFALALQGGAIGVLLLTVFAAFKLSGLIPAAAAFAISVVLVAGMCVLAVLQESRTLAVLGTLAGFLAPIWLSTGSGNHVALFSYYALLNAGVFAIAWVRAWRVLNLLGFVFTFGIGTVWGVLDYQPAKFASTEPFLLLFFAFYLLIPVLYARRGDTPARVIDGSLLFGTPLVAFSLQACLLEGEGMPLALCALVLAALYAALAAWLVRAPRTALLGQTHALLAAGFATLAVPLALSARATASVFALEGAGLVWLGLRQQRRLPLVSGLLLQLAAAISFAIAVEGAAHDLVAVTNPGFMSALLIALGGFASAWLLQPGKTRALAAIVYLWALAWWAGAGFNEIQRFAASADQPDLVLALLALSAWLAAEMQRRRAATALVWTVMAAFALALPVALWQVSVHAQPFAGYGALAWLMFAVLGTRALWCLRGAAGGGAQAAQFIWWLVWPSMLSLAGVWLARHAQLAEGWSWALLALPWLLLCAISLLRAGWLAWPHGEALDGSRTALQATFLLVLACGWVLALTDSLEASPLPWLPLLNPGELAQLAVVVLFARWLWHGEAPAGLRQRRPLLMGLAGLALITSSTLHTVHHWGQVAWTPQLLWTSAAQTSLTVVWSVLGVIGWVSGSRRGQRGLWLGGALLMGLVLAKLVLVDRQHLGNLLGIGSFIAYGLLCTVVGYFAPAPPRDPAPATEVEG